MATGKKEPQPTPQQDNNNRLSVESKESSYMGFDRGIDSDIEIEPRSETNNAGDGGDPLATPRCSSEPHLKRRMVLTPKLARWESLDPPESGESETLVSPDIKSTEICKSNSSLRIKKGVNGSSAEGEKPPGAPMPLNDILKVNANHRTSGQGNSNFSQLEVPVTVTATGPQASAGSFTSIGSHSVVKYSVTSQGAHRYSSDSLLIMLSGIYAKLLIVMGVCFPVAEVISKRIPISYYEGFYLYLYSGSISFLLFLYCFVLKSETPRKNVSCKTRMLSCFRSFNRSKSSASRSDDLNSNQSDSTKSLNQAQREARSYEPNNCGNFYLRLGAVAFGIASMIYSGLEFGQFFELDIESSCYHILYGVTPTARMAFTFIQMYFIFLNSRICVKRYRAFARFGLMHMIATNLCVWLHVLVQETKHGILTLLNVNLSLPLSTSVPLNMIAEAVKEENFANLTLPIFEIQSNRSVRSIREEISYVGHECRRTNIMGELVQEASHFLFPCAIQYSLICAAILYIMWKNLGRSPSHARGLVGEPRAPSGSAPSRPSTPQHYHQMDCAKANKGLFTGILVLVLSIISVILFFVLIGKPEHRLLAIIGARITELGLYLMTSVAVACALIQVRELKYGGAPRCQAGSELDHILLIVAQCGLYLYTMFSIIGGHFAADRNTLLVLATSVACIAQATLQTVFVLDASRCRASTQDQLRRKPGRELVTFLLVCNFAMWAMNTLQAQRADSNPVQLQFYGIWAWTIITHVTTPLAVYFRFHSTVCLCAIWKKTYKMKSDFV